MRSLAFRNPISSKRKASFLLGLLFVILLKMALKYGMDEPPEDSRTDHAASDAVLLTSLHPITSAFREPRPSVVHRKPSETATSKGADKDLVITQEQRSLHIVYRLSRFSGTGHGRSRVSNLIVSSIGILGMFSAIVGAIVGPWLAETGDGSADDERFSFWVCEEDEEDDDERTCGLSREEKYTLHRLLDVP